MLRCDPTFLSKKPRIPDIIIVVERKQAPTPINMATPRLAKPGQMENTNEPNANIVVALVRRIALPVLAKT